MGPSPFPRLPGWYGDPDDPSQFRYWDGEAWTFGRRRRPTWAEQAARNLTPAVPARRSDGGQPSAQRAEIVLDGPVRHLRPQNLRPYRPLAPVWPDNGSLPRPGPSGRRVRWRDEPGPIVRPEPITPIGRLAAGPGRWPLIGFLLMCMLAMLGLASTLGLSSTAPQTFTAVETDAGFISDANAACGAVLPKLRGLTGGSSKVSKVSTGSISAPARNSGTSSSSAGTGSASAGAGQAGGTLAHLRSLSALRTKLTRIHANRTAAPYLDAWLTEWRTYIHDRHGYLTHAGEPAVARLPNEAQATAEQADRFATSNGLGSCTLLSRAVQF